MTEINSSSSPCNLNVEDQNPNPTHLSSSIYTASPQTSSSSSLSCHIIFNKSSTLLNDYHKDILQQPQSQQQADNYNSHGGSYNTENESESESGLKFSIWKKQVMMTNANNQSSESNTSSNIQLKWMSSKMRLMNKMKNNNSSTPTAANAPLMKLEDQKQQDSSSVSPTSPSNNTTIRVCSDCNTTKTPLWRSGPRGPKSLCNACGIRQRKARRAMAAAAAAAATNGTILLSERSSPIKISKVQQHKEKRSNGPKYKKRCKIAANTSHSRKELRFEEFLMSLSKNLALHRMFPQDEKEAAILLMALSCGHIHG